MDADTLTMPLSDFLAWKLSPVPELIDTVTHPRCNPNYVNTLPVEVLEELVRWIQIFPNWGRKFRKGRFADKKFRLMYRDPQSDQLAILFQYYP